MPTQRAERIPPTVADWREHANLGFGKYALWPLERIPPTYLLWLLAQAWFKRRDPTSYAAVREIAVRYLKAEALYD